MNYYYLKLGHGNREADSLGETGELGTASVYFDDLGEADYEAGKASNGQARDFFGCSKPGNRNGAVMVVLHDGNAWLLRPAGKIRFGRPAKNGDGTWATKKTMPVRVLAKVPLSEVPPVLAGIGCNQFHGRRTFTPIGHWGNRKAIDCVLAQHAPTHARPPIYDGVAADASLDEHWRWLKPEDDANGKKGDRNQWPLQLLECLGSTEFETLVARLLEAHGCHVPAHRGGTLKDIDLFAWNDSMRGIDLGGLKIGSGRRISIQVKSSCKGSADSKGVDYLIGIGAKGDSAFDEVWLLKQVQRTPSVVQWLRRSLDWLPQPYLDRFLVNPSKPTDP
jgi:hypothetical protein